MRFISNCRTQLNRHSTPVNKPSFLLCSEMRSAETYWLKVSQNNSFSSEMKTIEDGKLLPKGFLSSLNPFVDPVGLFRVGGRLHNSKLPYNHIHPIILHGDHPITKLIVRSEHLRMLHAGPTLLSTTVSLQFHIIGCRRLIRSITRSCITCRRLTVRPQHQLMGRLPMERVTPGNVFEQVGVDYSGPVLYQIWIHTKAHHC